MTFVHWFGLGIIRDDIEILKANQNSDGYFENANWLYLSNAGILYLDGFTDPQFGYCQAIRETDTIITMSLDRDKKTISYKINDKQCKTMTIPLSINKFRLALSMNHKDTEFELL